MSKLRFLAIGFGSQDFNALQEIAESFNTQQYGQRGAFRRAITGQELNLGSLVATDNVQPVMPIISQSSQVTSVSSAPLMGCRPDRCGGRDRLREDGTCETCPDYWAPTLAVVLADGRTLPGALARCEPARCGRRAAPTRLGTC